MVLRLKGSFERSCRLCAKEQDVTIMLFSKEAEAMLLKNKLNKYLLLEVDEDDKLPKNICIQCCTKLQTVCEFIDSAHKAQDVLLERSVILDEMISPPHFAKTLDIQSGDLSLTVDNENDMKVTEMEISVDPMIVLQNSPMPMSPISSEDSSHPFIEDVTSLHGVDSENVSIKLIRNGVSKSPPRSQQYIEQGKPFYCEICQRRFVTELALLNHSWTHVNEEKQSQYTCNTCSEEFDYKCDLITHLRNHRNSGMCQICGRVFRTEQNLATHMSGHLAEGKAHPCKVCGRTYSTRSMLKTHSITHSTERPYQCEQCKKSFKRNQDLKFHMNQHTGAKPYKCPFCDKSFASSGNCYSHRSRMHPGRRVETKIRRRDPARPNTLRPIAPKTALTSVKGIYKYQCNICDHSFMKRENYTYHMFQHTGEMPFKCTFCPEKFVTRRGLLIHHDKMHPTKDRPLFLISKNALLK